MCNITELGFVRVACGKAGFAANVRVAQRDFIHLKAKQPFRFLEDGLGASLLPSWVERSKQVTDGHLLRLAQTHGARLVTLDAGIPGALLIPEQPENTPVVGEPPARYGGIRAAWAVPTRINGGSQVDQRSICRPLPATLKRLKLALRYVGFLTERWSRAGRTDLLVHH
jgi:hypothetical protein